MMWLHALKAPFAHLPKQPIDLVRASDMLVQLGIFYDGFNNLFYRYDGGSPNLDFFGIRVVKLDPVINFCC